MFRERLRYFVMSVWHDRAPRDAYAVGEVRGPMMREQARLLLDFISHSYDSDTIPDGKQAKLIWRQATRRQ